MNRVCTNCLYFRKKHRVLWWCNMGKLCIFNTFGTTADTAVMSGAKEVALCLSWGQGVSCTWQGCPQGRGWASTGGNLVLLFQHWGSPSYMFVKQTLKWICYLMPFWRLQSGTYGFSRHSSICKLCSSDIYVSETVCILLFPMFQTRTVTRLLPVELGKE